MTTKLTLTIDDHLVNEAKAYAKSVNRSLSDLISSYLKTITKNKQQLPDHDPDLDALIGCISLPDRTSYKEIKDAYLNDKYGNQ